MKYYLVPFIGVRVHTFRSIGSNAGLLTDVRRPSGETSFPQMVIFVCADLPLTLIAVEV